jgi:glutamate-1-semialdehyde 2,1-aminomutase
MDKNGDNIAAVILEPVIANTGLILPKKEFLRTLREETTKHNTILIFDEVVTGFRLSLGGAKEYFSIEPDMVTLGKILGGGFPIGCVAANYEIMRLLSPLGKVFNAGTFNANPISIVAGLATIEEIEKGYVYKWANLAAEKIADAIHDNLDKYGINGCVNHISSMYQVFFTPKDLSEVINSADARRSDKELYVEFHRKLIEKGIYIPPSQFETCFTSASHKEDIVEETISVIEETIKTLREAK